MKDAFNLQRFVQMHEDAYQSALAEVRAGAKRTHWMWFIFPQLRGLGHSPAAQHFGITSLEEARAYLAHPELGPRLRDCAEALVLWSGRRSGEQIFGPIDARKLRSSMTLFDQVEPGCVFAEVLEGFYGGQRDERTLALLNGWD